MTREEGEREMGLHGSFYGMVKTLALTLREMGKPESSGKRD